MGINTGEKWQRCHGGGRSAWLAYGSDVAYVVNFGLVEGLLQRGSLQGIQACGVS